VHNLVPLCGNVTITYVCTGFIL